MKTLTLFAILFISSAFISRSETNQEDVLKVAKNEMEVFLTKIPEGQESHFGFSNRDEFKISSVSKPFRLITFNQDFYKEEKLSTKNYISLLNEWRVPVAVKGENRVLLTIGYRDSSLMVVDIGGALLSKELQQKGDGLLNNQFLLRIYPLKADFIMSADSESSTNNAVCIPMTSAFMAIKGLKNAPKSKLTLSEVQLLVKEELNERSKVNLK